MKIKAPLNRIFCCLFIVTIHFTPGLNAQYHEGFSSPLIDIGVVVSDLEAAKEFYTEVIGMVEVGGFDINEDFGKRSGLTGGEPFSVTILKLEDSPSANQWKIMSFGEKEAPKQDFIQDNTGMQYITINVKALQPVIDRIEERNITFLGDTPTYLRDDRYFVLIKDPAGNFIELIGPK